MKKIGFVMLALGLFNFASCASSNDGMDDTTDEVEEKVDKAADEVEDAADKATDEVKEEVHDDR